MRKLILLYSICIALFTACGDSVVSPEQIEKYPSIYPDYIGVTIPATIAPMNFSYTDTSYERIDVIVKGCQGKEVHINAKHVNFPEKEWKQLLISNQGDSLLFTVSIKQEGKWSTYKPFPMYISPHPIDYGLVYRKIAPGYEVYSRMGIYERDLSSHKERPLVENTLVKGMCTADIMIKGTAAVQVMVDPVKTSLFEHFCLVLCEKAYGAAEMSSVFFHFADPAG